MSEHYFAPEPSSRLHHARVRVRAWGHELELRSASGVFAHGRVDLGTGVLLRTAAPDPAARTVLDLGCGYGVLAVGLAVKLPQATVWAVDVNERALATTRANVAAHRLAHRVRVVIPAEVAGDLRFDEIWSNPPIRIGKPAVHALLTDWLGRLAPAGRAVLVIGRNLGADSYQHWLLQRGWACERLGSAKGFRVLEVRHGGADDTSPRQRSCSSNPSTSPARSSKV